MMVELRRWDAGDLPLLVAANTPEMTQYLGGPESDDDLVARNERYLRLWQTGDARMYRIDVDGVPAGGIGYWAVDHEGVPAFETGWNVLPGWQGKGVARQALGHVIREIVDEGSRSLLVAYSAVGNGAANALCRSAGFEQHGSTTAQWRGGELTFNAWVLDLSRPLVAGAAER